MELVIVTGMSGAGKSQAIKALEDAGYYCVDNMPPKLLMDFVALGQSSQPPSGRLAVVVDIRGKEMFADFFRAVDKLKAKKTNYHILFLDADDSVLLHRFLETRRRHPLMEKDSDSLEDSIALERSLMQPIRDIADCIMDTGSNTSHQLRERIAETFGGGGEMSVVCTSFGYKNGLPADADIVFDMRCLANPFYVDELKALTGRDRAVVDYLWGIKETRELFDRICSLLELTLPMYLSQGKSRLSIAFGCTGGQHRSVAFAEAASGRLRELGYRVSVAHRDLKD